MYHRGGPSREVAFNNCAARKGEYASRVALQLVHKGINGLNAVQFVFFVNSDTLPTNIQPTCRHAVERASFGEGYHTGRLKIPDVNYSIRDVRKTEDVTVRIK